MSHRKRRCSQTETTNDTTILRRSPASLTKKTAEIICEIRPGAQMDRLQREHHTKVMMWPFEFDRKNVPVGPRASKQDFVVVTQAIRAGKSDMQKRRTARSAPGVRVLYFGESVAA